MSLTPKDKLDDKIQKDLHLIYSVSIDDIRFAKQQQWRMTYYALLLMAGIFYIRTNNQFPLIWHIILIIITVLIAGFAVVFIIEIENDIVGYRHRIVQTRKGLSDEFIRTIKIHKDYL